jgi:hypothetical protein
MSRGERMKNLAVARRTRAENLAERRRAAAMRARCEEIGRRCHPDAAEVRFHGLSHDGDPLIEVWPSKHDADGIRRARLYVVPNLED